MEPATALRISRFRNLRIRPDGRATDRQLEMKMREGVHDEAGYRLPIRMERGVVRDGAAIRRLLLPRGGRRLQHAAKQAFEGPFA